MNSLPLSLAVALWQAVQMSYHVVMEGENRPPMKVMLETLDQARRFLDRMKPPPGVQFILTDADGVVLDTRMGNEGGIPEPADG